MNRTRESARALTAADVMSRDVVTIHHRMPLRAAARVFAYSRTLALPVTDDRGRCVGVLSAAEVFRWAGDGGPWGAGGHDTSATTDWQVMAPGTGRTDEVRWYLTADPAVVTPDASLPEVVRLILDTRTCCVVVNEQRRPVGMISGADLLAANYRALPKARGLPDEPPARKPAARRSLALPVG
jgi:CBS domain-containing membrane protein